MELQSLWSLSCILLIAKVTHMCPPFTRLTTLQHLFPRWPNCHKLLVLLIDSTVIFASCIAIFFPLSYGLCVDGDQRGRYRHSGSRGSLDKKSILEVTYQSAGFHLPQSVEGNLPIIDPSWSMVLTKFWVNLDLCIEFWTYQIVYLHFYWQPLWWKWKKTSLHCELYLLW